MNQLHPSILRQGQIVTLRMTSLDDPANYSDRRVKFSGDNTFNNPVGEHGIPSCWHLNFSANQLSTRYSGHEFTLWECRDRSTPKHGWSYEQ